MKKKIVMEIGSVVFVVALLVGGVRIASAQVATTTSSSRVSYRAQLAQRLQNIVNRANQEIERRITALTTLSNRVSEMQKISPNDKSALLSSIQAQISAMNALQAQIGMDQNSTSSLRVDVQSITGQYRIFALIIPRGAIEAAADRVMTIVSNMTTIVNKLQTRIPALSSPVSPTAASDIADFNAKITDANTQAQAALSEVTPLMPDNGSSTLMQANTSALKEARADIKTAQQDLTTAYQDIVAVVKALIARGTPTTTSTATSSS